LARDGAAFAGAALCPVPLVFAMARFQLFPAMVFAGTQWWEVCRGGTDVVV